MNQNLVLGKFSPLGIPVLRIAVAGLKLSWIEVNAIIDAGFEGFLVLPFKMEGVRNLAIIDIQRIRFAYGTQKDRLVALVTVSLQEIQHSGLAIIEPESEEIIIGMQFLRTFNRGLIIMPLAHNVILPFES